MAAKSCSCSENRRAATSVLPMSPMRSGAWILSAAGVVFSIASTEACGGKVVFTGVTAEHVCDEKASSYCDLLAQCKPLPLASEYGGDVAMCKTRQALLCRAQLSLS